jgi:hypothetical protein
VSDNPFKEEEQMSVFKDSSTNDSNEGASVFAENEEKATEKEPIQESAEDGYSRFPKWDLLPPFKLINRGGKK